MARRVNRFTLQNTFEYIIFNKSAIDVATAF